MFPNGVGLFFSGIANGVNTLYYYASRTKTLLLSNAGLVTSIAVGTYFFPRQSAAAFGGAVVSTGASWIATEVDSRYDVHIANLHDWLFEHVSGNTRQKYGRTMTAIARPSSFISRYPTKRDRQLYFINDNFVSELLAPVYEEVAYRYVGQELLSRLMQALGVPSSFATITALAISDSIFAGSHAANPREGRFKDTLITGAVFGAMMHFCGLPGAILNHSYHNACLRLRTNGL